MKDYNNLEFMKEQLSHELTKKQEGINSIISNLDLVRTKIDVFKELQHKGNYFKDNYNSLLQKEDDLEKQLTSAKEECSNISLVIDFISNKLKNS